MSGREGISLREADALVYYNIDFSATSYWQSRDRMTTKDRRTSKVYWLFSERGIEKDIYKAVSNKKDYTLKHFKRFFMKDKELKDETLFADGFNDAIVGLSSEWENVPRVVYSKHKMILILLNEGLSYEDALEHLQYNVWGAYVGEGYTYLR